jgi:hypothetical protein
MVQQTPKVHMAISNPFPLQQDSQPLTRTVQSPGVASSKYSQSPKSERYVNVSSPLDGPSRPNIAHHPAMTQGGAL